LRAFGDPNLLALSDPLSRLGDDPPSAGNLLEIGTFRPIVKRDAQLVKVNEVVRSHRSHRRQATAEQASLAFGSGDNWKRTSRKSAGPQPFSGAFGQQLDPWRACHSAYSCAA
jgi:hypothetical protein